MRRLQWVGAWRSVTENYTALTFGLTDAALAVGELPDGVGLAEHRHITEFGGSWLSKKGGSVLAFLIQESRIWFESARNR